MYLLQHKQTQSFEILWYTPIASFIASQVSRMATNEPTYEFDVVNLRTKRITTFRTAVNAIERQIKKVLQEEESEMHRKIDLFSIGKTNANATAKADFLDPLDEDTFTKKGISNRWRAHKDTDYGKDGMVVVAIITDDVADTLDYDDAEDCALDIEEELQDRFYSDDDRLIHEEYHEGARVENPADGYPIYITFAFTERSPQYTCSKHPSFPRQRETYPQEPRYFPPLQTRPYWPIQQQWQPIQQQWRPIQQHWQFPQTYYNRDWDEDSFFVPRRRPNSCYRYNPYR